VMTTVGATPQQRRSDSNLRGSTLPAPGPPSVGRSLSSGEFPATAAPPPRTSRPLREIGWSGGAISTPEGIKTSGDIFVSGGVEVTEQPPRVRARNNFVDRPQYTRNVVRRHLGRGDRDRGSVVPDAVRDAVHGEAARELVDRLVPKREVVGPLGDGVGAGRPARPRHGVRDARQPRPPSGVRRGESVPVGAAARGRARTAAL